VSSSAKTFVGSSVETGPMAALGCLEATGLVEGSSFVWWPVAPLKASYHLAAS